MYNWSFEGNHNADVALSQSNIDTPDVDDIEAFTVGKWILVILTISSWHGKKPHSGLFAKLTLKCRKDTLLNPLQTWISLKSHYRLDFKWLGPCLHSKGLHMKHLCCGMACCSSDSSQDVGIHRVQSSDLATFLFSSRVWKHEAINHLTFLWHMVMCTQQYQKTLLLYCDLYLIVIENTMASWIFFPQFYATGRQGLMFWCLCWHFFYV